MFFRKQYQCAFSSTENEKKIKIFKSKEFYFFDTAMRKKISLVKRRILYFDPLKF